MKNSKVRYFFLIAFFFSALVREENHNNYDLYCLILFPVLLCLVFMWDNPIVYFSKRLGEIIIIAIISFCFFGGKTVLSIFIPLSSGLITWGMLVLLHFWNRKRLEKRNVHQEGE